MQFRYTQRFPANITFLGLPNSSNDKIAQKELEIFQIDEGSERFQVEQIGHSSQNDQVHHFSPGSHRNPRSR